MRKYLYSVLIQLHNIIPLYRVTRDQLVGFIPERITNINPPDFGRNAIFYPELLNDFDDIYFTKYFANKDIKRVENEIHLRKIKSCPPENVKLADELRSMLTSNKAYYSICEKGTSSEQYIYYMNHIRIKLPNAK